MRREKASEPAVRSLFVTPPVANRVKPPRMRGSCGCTCTLTTPTCLQVSNCMDKPSLIQLLTQKGMMSDEVSSLSTQSQCHLRGHPSGHHRSSSTPHSFRFLPRETQPSYHILGTRRTSSCRIGTSGSGKGRGMAIVSATLTPLTVNPSRPIGHVTGSLWHSQTQSREKA